MPDNLTPFPQTIAGAELVMTQRVPSRPGELSELAILVGREAHRPEDRAYVVWTAAVRGGQWDAFGGLYDQSYDTAQNEFRDRINART